MFQNEQSCASPNWAEQSFSQETVSILQSQFIQMTRLVSQYSQYSKSPQESTYNSFLYSPKNKDQNIRALRQVPQFKISHKQLIGYGKTQPQEIQGTQLHQQHQTYPQSFGQPNNQDQVQNYPLNPFKYIQNSLNSAPPSSEKQKIPEKYQQQHDKYLTKRQYNIPDSLISESKRQNYSSRKSKNKGKCLKLVSDSKRTSQQQTTTRSIPRKTDTIIQNQNIQSNNRQNIYVRVQNTLNPTLSLSQQQNQKTSRNSQLEVNRNLQRKDQVLDRKDSQNVETKTIRPIQKDVLQRIISFSQNYKEKLIVHNKLIFLAP